MERWRTMAVKRLKFDKENCISCQLCMQVCSGMHDGEYSTSKARLSIESYYDKGKDIKFDDHICILCGICVKNCPTKSITLDGKITVNHDTCIGCGVCKAKCPTKVPQIRDKKSYICDLCDGEPSCVKVCPHGALKYV